MKYLLLFILLFNSLSSQAQDKKIKLAEIHRTTTEAIKTVDTTYRIYNPNGSYSIVEIIGDGNIYQY